MDGELRDYGLTVSQYACLQILASRPRISNADLARDAFVSDAPAYVRLHLG
jgi:DNA-binding MarR family transcriptional regulator